jgi:hypothetical protein
MSTKKRIRRLRAGIARFLFLSTVPAVISASALAATNNCHIVGNFYNSGFPHPGIPPDESIARFGVFTDAYKAYYLLRDGAVADLKVDIDRYIAQHLPYCPPAVMITYDVPYVGGTPIGDSPVSSPHWLAGWVINDPPGYWNNCSVHNGGLEIVAVSTLYAPAKKGFYLSDASVDKINTVCSEQQQYTIKLSNDANPPASGDLAEVEPGKATTTLRATVYDSSNQPVPNVNVKLEVTVEANSGGHLHDNSRPRGLLSNGVQTGTEVTSITGGDGMPFTFSAPAPAGDHKIKATCLDRDCTQEGPDKVWVGVKDLYQLNGSTAYELIQPNADVFHPGNHYLTANASIVLQGIASEWRTLYKPFGPVLHLNDASLERGGYFDIQRLWNRGEHAEHRRGTVIDIRANNLPGAIPRGDFKDFERAARKYGAVARLHKKNTDLQHYHVRLFGRPE